MIFRDGFSVHGLTTAASLWITSALGVMFGVGLYTLGAVGTVLTAAILIALRLVSKRMPHTAIVDADIVWRLGDPEAEGRIEALLSEIDGSRRGGRIELIDGGAAVRRRFRLGLRGEPALRDLSSRLQTIEGVTGYSLEPRDD
ncbi:MAG TPA: MgtC/SapB family protein [Brevundimonas sp.]|nr:MgtC/SapB family protein [Brevundimonas sp.]